MIATLLYAFTLGLVAAVNPCGFPLLPAYLAGFLAPQHSAGWATRTLRALVAGSCVTAGFILTFGLAGVLVSSGMALIGGWIPWVMLAVGAALTVLGIGALAGKHVSVRLPVVRFRSGRGALAMGGFGVAYAIGSLSCTLPLFLAGVVGSFSRAGFLGGLLSFVAYALGMGVFVIAASLVAAQFGAESLRAVRPLMRFMPVVASALVALVGLYLLYYWGADLVDPLAAEPVTRAVDTVQTAVSGWLTSSPFAVGGAAVIVVASLAALAWNSTRRANRREENTHHA